jgi:hypothetical protein
VKAHAWSSASGDVFVAAEMGFEQWLHASILF